MSDYRLFVNFVHLNQQFYFVLNKKKCFYKDFDTRRCVLALLSLHNVSSPFY